MLSRRYWNITSVERAHELWILLSSCLVFLSTTTQSMAPKLHVLWLTPKTDLLTQKRQLYFIHMLVSSVKRKEEVLWDFGFWQVGALDTLTKINGPFQKSWMWGKSQLKTMAGLTKMKLSKGNNKQKQQQQSGGK